MKFKNILWILFVFLAVSIGLYPVIYLFVDMTSNGLLSTKPLEISHNQFYLMVFYSHILFGGFSLLTGWSQFNKKIRNDRIKLHRLLGKIYIVSVLLSGICGLYISFYATGGMVSNFGFGLLAIFWIYFTLKAYFAIRKIEILNHQRWMIRSYALTFAAVTLRLYLPILPIILQTDFISAYRIISWMCWIPNLLVAEYVFISKRNLADELA